VRAPEDVAPEQIADLSASSTANGIELSWSRPRSYTDGSRMTDLGGFVVERSAGSEPRVAFQRITTLEVSDRDRFRQIKRFRYVDHDLAAGTYLYRVVSYTVDRYFSAPSNIVAAELASPTGEQHAPLPTTQR